MSYQNYINMGIDKHAHPSTVGPVQLTQAASNQQANLTTTLGKPIDKGKGPGGMMAAATMNQIDPTIITKSNMPMGHLGSCSLETKPTTFYNQISNLQSHLRINAHSNTTLTGAPNYGTNIRMPSHYNTNFLLPHGTKRKQKDPNRPKRPTTAYFYFAQLEREAAAKRGERISKVSEWTKQVAEKWRNLSEEERTQFRTMAAGDKTRFDHEMAIYTGKDANKPKRPQSSYFLWLADFRVRMKDKIAEHKEILRAAGEEWRKLTLEDKAPYEQMAEEERKKYECRMKEYQEMNKRAKVEATSPTNCSTLAETISSASQSRVCKPTEHPRDQSRETDKEDNCNESSNDEDDNNDNFSEDEE